MSATKEKLHDVIEKGMRKLESISEIKLKLNSGKKLNCSETHLILEELKGNKYIDLLLKQKENLLLIMGKLNKARKESVSALNGGSGAVSLNMFAAEMQEVVSNQITDLDNKISEIAELDSIYYGVS